MFLVFTLAATLTAGSARPTKVAMADLEAGPGVGAPLAHLLTTLVVAEVRKLSGQSITSQDEIKALLGLEREKRLLACAEISCLAEVGGALGVDQMITGSVAKLGESLLLVLRLVDVRRARVIREVTRRLRNAEADAVVDILPETVAELFAEAPPAPLFAAPSVAPPPPAPAVTAPPITPAPPPPAEVRRSQTNAPWWIAGAGGVVAAVGVGLLIYGVSTAHGGAPGVTAYDLTYGQSQAVGGVGEIATAAGTAALLSGLGWELLRPAPRSTP